MSILGFEVEWFDQISGLMQQLYLKFFVDDNTVELLRDSSAFLKRIYYPDVRFCDLFLGNTITIHNRLYTIKKYCNVFTQQYMQEREVHYLCVIPARQLRDVGKLLNIAKKHQLSTGRIYTTSIDAHYESESLGQYYVVSAKDVIVELVGLSGAITNSSSGVSGLQSRASRRSTTNDPFLAETEQKLREVSITHSSVEDIQGLLNHCQGLIVDFPCTLCLVKPHIMKKQRLGELIEFILENNYSVFGIVSIHMTVPMIEEFFDVYRNVFVNYSKCLEHFADGPCVAIGIMGNYLDEDWSSKYHRPATSGGTDIVSDFREFVGPQNPELAKVLRPKSLRAAFGDTGVRNAVHCTDLPTDGEMECRYFFEALANLK